MPQFPGGYPTLTTGEIEATDQVLIDSGGVTKGSPVSVLAAETNKYEFVDATGTTHTLATSDQGKIVEMTNSAVKTLTVPVGGSFKGASPILVWNNSVEVINITVAFGATLNDAVTTIEPGAAVTFVPVGTSIWRAISVGGATGSGTGDITNGANVGSGPVDVFKAKSGTNLQFRTLLPIAGAKLTENTSDIEITTDQKGYKSNVKAHDVSNFRNDAAAGVHISGDTFFSAWTRFGAGSGDADAATIYGAFSTDGGKTWGSATSLVTILTSERNMIPNLIKKTNNTYILLWYRYASGSTKLFKKTSADCVTWSAETQVFDFTTINAEGYADPAAQRVLRWNSTTLLLPMGVHVSGAYDSSTGIWDGRLLKSTDDGETWTDTTLNVTSSDGMAGEPGIIKTRLGLFYYWRTRSGYGLMKEITNTTTFATVGSEQQINLPTPNTDYTLYYDTNMDLALAAYSPIMSDLTTPIAVNPDNRRFMSIAVSDGTLKRWQRVHDVDTEVDMHFFEPTFLAHEDKIILLYSDGYYDSPDYKHTLRSKVFPVSMFYASSLYHNHRTVMAEFAPEPWQTGAFEAPLFWLRFIKFLDGYYKILGNNSLGYTGFAPVIRIKTSNTDRGMETHINAALDPGGEPFFRTTYLNSGAAPASTILLEEHIGTGGATVIKVWADGKWYNGFLNDSSGTDKVVLVNNGVVKLGSAPGGGGGGSYTFGQGLTEVSGAVSLGGSLSAAVAIDANGNYIAFTEMPNMRMSNNGSVTRFIGDLSAATDNKWLGETLTNGVFSWSKYTDGLSGISNSTFLLFDGASNLIEAHQRFVMTDGHYISHTKNLATPGFMGNYFGDYAAYIGVSFAAHGINTGDAAGDIALRTSTKKITFSVDGGSTATVTIKTNGGVDFKGLNNESYELATDADLTLSKQSTTLPVITANRTLTLPAATDGTTIIILNTNTAGFAWSFAAGVYKPDGTSFTTIDNVTVYTLVRASSQWRMVSKQA